MNNKKKFKSLINSITSDRSGMEGTLQKIREMFLEDLIEEVRKVIPKTEDKINLILEKFEEVLSEKESRISNVKDYLNTVDLGNFDQVDGKLKDIQKAIESIDEKIKRLDEIFVNVTNLVEKGQKEIKNGRKAINDLLSTSFDEIHGSLQDALNSIRQEAVDHGSILERQVKAYKQSLNDNIENHNKKFELYLKEKGTKLILQYVRRNAFKIIWVFFMGIITFGYSGKKST